MTQQVLNAAEVVLTRRNLLALLKKLDEVKEGVHSECTIIKSDIAHPKYPLKGCFPLTVKAVEDEEYYTDREPGKMWDNKENKSY